jgi:phosphate transport system substrate-binding protein
MRSPGLPTQTEASVLKRSLTLTVLAAAVAATGAYAAARDYISIAGSSTVYPFSTAVAEKAGKSRGIKTPKVESTGTGGGFKLFCQGIGVDTTDISNASRRIKKSEFDTCQANGAKDIIEVKIGYDGIAIANSKAVPVVNMSLKDVYLALAKNVPDPAGSGKLVPNPYKSWKEVNKDLPDQKIEVLGPPPTSGTRDAFVELAMEGGCKKIDSIKAMEKTDEKAFKAACHTIREDGAFIEAGENDNLIVQKLAANKNAFGVFGFSFLDQNNDKVQGAVIDGKAANFENIASGAYPVSRSMFIYVKKAHVDVIPGIREYLEEFTSEKAWGKNGYLSEKGMIPMPDAERKQYAAAAKELTTMTGEGLK